MKRKTTTKIIFAGLLLNTMALIGLGVSHTITISNLEKENTNNKETIQTLNAENEALKGQIETLTNKNTLTQKEIDELNEAVKKLNTKVDSLEELYNNFAYQVKKGDTGWFTSWRFEL